MFESDIHSENGVYNIEMQNKLCDSIAIIG